MKTLPQPLTVSQIAALVGGEALGSFDHAIFGVAEIAEARTEHAAFLENPKYASAAVASQAGLLFVSPRPRTRRRRPKPRSSSPSRARPSPSSSA
ncbi:MAG: hypothetical protein M0D55_19925 [Elusimicrobiota bacterium]|nr:MAG: hypothetical protein M0D55_19925 [Elusimicrobiota bacterium]